MYLKLFPHAGQYAWLSGLFGQVSTTSNRLTKVGNTGGVPLCGNKGFI